MKQSNDGGKREPKRRNAAATKARIIAAAQELFSGKGYGQASMRDIAQKADVAVSLLVQHFGSKADLFEATLLAAMESSQILEGPRHELGGAIVDRVLSDGDVRLPAMVVLSIGDAEARAISERILREHVIPQLAETLGPPNAYARATEFVMIATGFAIYGRHLPVGELSDRTRAHIAQLLQSLIDEA